MPDSTKRMAQHYLVQRLSMHCGVHGPGLKLIKVLAQQLQALICWVISVKPEACITGVVVPAMEVLHASSDNISWHQLRIGHRSASGWSQ